MNELIIAGNIIANCSDGSVHDDVTMKVVDNQIIFETQNGEHLCGDCCVKTMDKAVVYVGAHAFAIAMQQYKQQESQS